MRVQGAAADGVPFLQGNPLTIRSQMVLTLRLYTYIRDLGVGLRLRGSSWRLAARRVRIGRMPTVPRRRAAQRERDRLEARRLRAAELFAAAIRQLRDLTRYRKRLIQTHNAECQRIQKTLEDAGIKLDGSVASGRRVVCQSRC
jgi:hypothetical protein